MLQVHTYAPLPSLCVLILTSVSAACLFWQLQLYVKRGQLDAKMLGALLTGVNRAFPFMKGTNMGANCAWGIQIV